MLASAVPPITWLSQAKPPQWWQVGKELPAPPETVDPPLYKISFRCWNWAPGLLWKTMNISLLEAKDCVISASNSCFLRGLGGCGALSSPLEHFGKLPRVCTQGYPLLCGAEGGMGRGERVRECARLFKLFYYRVWETSSKGSPCGLLQYA